LPIPDRAAHLKYRTWKSIADEKHHKTEKRQGAIEREFCQAENE